MLRRGLLISAALTLLMVVPAAISQASPTGARSGGGSSLRLTGPKNNKADTTFTYTVSGEANGGADFLVAWEQFYPVSGCAKTYAAESTRTWQPKYGALTVFLDQDVSHGFSTKEQFYAEHPGKHGICAYLINLATGDTYVYAGAFWNNA
jgi:hypothetical protein